MSAVALLFAVGALGAAQEAFDPTRPPPATELTAEELATLEAGGTIHRGFPVFPAIRLRIGIDGTEHTTAF